MEAGAEGFSTLTIENIDGLKEIAKINLKYMNETSIVRNSEYFIGEREGKLFKYNIKEKKEELIYEGKILKFSLSLKGDYLLIITEDKKLHLIDLKNNTNSLEQQLLINDTEYIQDIKWSNDNKNVIFMYDKENGEEYISIADLYSLENINGYARLTESADIYKNNQKIGTVPLDYVVLLENHMLKKPIYGNIDEKKLEQLYQLKENYFVLPKEEINVYKDSSKQLIIKTLKSGTILKNVFYSKILNMFYVEKDAIKGWIDTDKMDVVIYSPQKIVLSSDFKSDSSNKFTYVYYSNLEGTSYYLDNYGWIIKDDSNSFIETNKNRKVYSLINENKVYDDLGKIEKYSLNLGESSNILGEVDSYYLIESNGNVGWVKKESVTYTKIDVENPKINIERMEINEEGLLTIIGNVSDDSKLEKLLINNIEIKLYEKTEDKEKEIYRFEYQWLLLKNSTNSIKLEIIDKTGKKTVKVINFDENLNTIE